ncbi:metallophosphoesterase family protein [Niabella soli]|uniref:Metallophosphoesterase n=1 Tax=Niabella soli DSM 19437 TaxID=929713 RepID=W0EVC9_9BACT|nr:metallophosphoesterase [Niabella soli]AHF14750.1 metallophosphoesterase [Niabella soli DSM 19437]
MKRQIKKNSIKEQTGTHDSFRFAQPFFTTLPPEKRPLIRGVGRRMTDYIATKLLPIPDPQRNPTMTLADIIGQQGTNEIITAGSIKFHAVGDTWNPNNIQQMAVTNAMTKDYSISAPQHSPAFFLHLGDVNYYNNTDSGYHEQFYVPYKTYPGKIIAIPGNHDGELFKYDGTSTGQKTTLEAFMRNFCQPAPGVPPAAGTIYREMPSQPGVYWHLDAPFVDIIGLYSNIAENPGYIADNAIVGQKQKNWLQQALTTIQQQRTKNARKALVIVTHHPPYSNGGHSGSAQMLAGIDDACTKAGIMPDAVLAGHSHNYQRYTRTISFNKKSLQIPFIVAGTGGRNADPVTKPSKKKTGGVSFDQSLSGYGYLLVTASPQFLSFNFYQVKTNTVLYDSVKVNLTTNKLV